MSYYPAVARSLGTLALIAIVLAVALGAAMSLPSGRSWLQRTMQGRERHPIAWAWLVALIAMGGSLYLSEIVGLIPCRLCWYQRIAMYPLVVLLLVSFIRGDAGVWRYATPLSVIGLVISTYHVAVQLSPSLEIVPCESGVPCSARYMAEFGFVSIPVMASTAFLLITAVMVMLRVVEHPADAPSLPDR